MTKKVLLLFHLLILFVASDAQPYVEGGKTRHRFAQLNFGLNARSFLSMGTETSVIGDNDFVERRSLGNHYEARVKIGGTHFWGHADFEIAIPLASFAENNFKTGLETGVKIFPLRIENKKIRPYLGISWMPVKYRQGEGTELIMHKFPVTSGVVYNFKNKLFEIGCGYNYDNKINYYLNTNNFTPVKLHSFWISAGIKYMFETSLSAEKNWLNGNTGKITNKLEKSGKLNGFTIAAGASSAFYLKKSKHNIYEIPFIDNHKISRVFPEFGIGYYFHKPDIQINLAGRVINSRLEAFEYTQVAKRKSLTLEAYKFFTDYHGFAAFAGAGLSSDWLSVSESYPVGNSYAVNKNVVKPAIIFGWDIRPDRLQTWYLRTNLRWYHDLNIRMNSGKEFSFDQLEINFIQLVIFPGRFKLSSK